MARPFNGRALLANVNDRLERIIRPASSGSLRARQLLRVLLRVFHNRGTPRNNNFPEIHIPAQRARIVSASGG